MKGLCPECETVHKASEACSPTIEHFKADAYRDENKRFAKERRQWDEWYSSLPADLKARLSAHDFKRLGDLFKQAFG